MREVRRRLPPLRFYSSQMAFLARELKDVSNSQRCLLGKLILQGRIVSVLVESETERERIKNNFVWISRRFHKQIVAQVNGSIFEMLGGSS